MIKQTLYVTTMPHSNYPVANTALHWSQYKSLIILYTKNTWFRGTPHAYLLLPDTFETLIAWHSTWIYYLTHQRSLLICTHYMPLLHDTERALIAWHTTCPYCLTYYMSLLHDIPNTLIAWHSTWIYYLTHQRSLLICTLYMPLLHDTLRAFIAWHTTCPYCLIHYMDLLPDTSKILIDLHTLRALIAWYITCCYCVTHYMPLFPKTPQPIIDFYSTGIYYLAGHMALIIWHIKSSLFPGTNQVSYFLLQHRDSYPLINQHDTQTQIHSTSQRLISLIYHRSHNMHLIPSHTIYPLSPDTP